MLTSVTLRRANPKLRQYSAADNAWDEVSLARPYRYTASEFLYEVSQSQSQCQAMEGPARLRFAVLVADTLLSMGWVGTTGGG